MKTIKQFSSFLLLMAVGLFSNNELKYADKSVNIEVKGTSNLHDWSIKSDAGLVDATIAMGTDNKTASLSKLNFSVASSTFKSGHSGMDKNVYKALQATEHPNITFELSSAPTVPLDGTNHTLNASGKLTVAGVSKPISLSVNCVWNSSEKSLVINGGKSFKMTEYNVKPPTALFGTIKTGDEIAISFYVKITK